MFTMISAAVRLVILEWHFFFILRKGGNNQNTVENSEWIMRGLDWDNPYRVRTWQEFVNWINEIGRGSEINMLLSVPSVSCVLIVGLLWRPKKSITRSL